MHIPDHMLNGAVCQVSAAIVSVVGVTASAILAVKSKEKPSPLRFAAVAMFIFAAQMMNFPVLNGTSGHFLGATLAVILLGIPFGILSTTMVLVVQCLAFGDGGLSVLGVNILNMALIGAVPGAILTFLYKSNYSFNKIQKSVLLFTGSWLSVVLASLFCSAELGLSGTINFTTVFSSMVGVHSLIGLFEGVITVALYLVATSEKVQKSERLSIGIPVVSALIIGLVLSPFANGFPDGLEWVAEKFAFFTESAPIISSPFNNYSLSSINNEILAVSVAGFIGVIITFIAVFGLGYILNTKYGKAQARVK